MDFTLNLNLQSVQLVIEALGQMPHHQVRGLIDHISQQAQAQQNAANEAATAAQRAETEQAVKDDVY